MAQRPETGGVNPNLWAALAPDGFLKESLKEAAYLGLSLVESHANLLVFEGVYKPLAWAAVNWKEVRVLEIASINDAARKLRPLARKWNHVSTVNHRRGTLIQDQLRAYRRPETNFPILDLEEGVGAFTLVEPNRILYCTSFDRPDPEGVIRFRLDKSAPSRAYLKLWEALLLLGRHPQPQEKCIDLGSCPGGWTWVAAKLGANVTGVDRSPLAPSVAAMPGVEYRAGDAFQVLPENTAEVDWLFSDVICYPEKLFDLVEAWVTSGKAGNMVCTIKFQGEPEPAVIEKFQKLGRVLHLHHNKHELTFLR